MAFRVKLGLTEIIVILVVISLVIGATRFLPRRSPPLEVKPSRKLTALEVRDQEILRNRRSGGKIAGAVLILIGVLLIVTAPSLIKAFFMSYIGGALIIVIGLASFFFLSRRS